MKSEQHLTFTPTGAGVHVDLEKLVQSRALLQANSGALRSLGLIEYPQQGFVRASDLLFLGSAT